MLKSALVRMRDRTLRRWWPKDPYLLAAALVFALVLIRFFVPSFEENEADRLLPGRRLIDPSFLKQDWIAGHGPTGPELTLLFSTVLAPLWLCLKEPLAVALAGRLLQWGLLLYALAKFAKEIQVKWYWFAAGLALWIWSGQSMAAGEWVFGGIEQKCPAYAFLLLSLTSLLRRQMLRAALFCGIAIWFHLLVGGWGAVALTGALFTRFHEYGRRQVLTFTLLVAILSVPLLMTALRYMTLGSSAGLVSQQAVAPDFLVVVFRHPHHLDPSFFLTLRKLLAVCLFTVCTFFAVPKVVPTSKARFLLAFLTVLVGVFGAGIVARQCGLLSFLKSYPFRVGDVLIPLVFWLVAPGVLAEQAPSLARRSHSPGAIPVFRVLGVLLISAVVVWKTSVAVRLVPPELTKFTRAWLLYRSQVQDPFEEMTRWIGQHTPKSATVIAPPCEDRFRPRAERAVVATFKTAPHNATILEWHRRLTHLNGGHEFRSTGFNVCAELMQNFPALRREQLRALRETYTADYYLTTREREDLREYLIHRNAAYYLYALSNLPGK